MTRIIFQIGLKICLCLTSIPLVAQERLSPAPPETFSIVVIPDTQAYSKQPVQKQTKNSNTLINPIFDAHSTWIAENLKRQNIVFVSHVGDIVDKNIHDQWKVARNCMDRLHGKVPYGISVGNHDMTSGGNSTLFQQYFPQSRFADFDWYHGCYTGSPQGPQISGNNANSCQLFSAGGMDFIFLHLECNAPDDVLAWANQTLQQHSQRRAMITTHMGWGPLHKPKTNREYITGKKGRMAWSKIHGKRGNTPQQLWDKCYKKHANLFAVFSGDQSRTQAMHATHSGNQGNQIHEVLQDYSTGWLRLFRFYPREDRIEVITFHPQSEILCQGTDRVSSRDEHQFQLEYKMLPQTISNR